MEPLYPSRILVIQFRRIGDVLLSTPVIKALKHHRPSTHLAFLTELESRSLMETNPYLDQLLVWDKRKYNEPGYLLRNLKELRKQKFDTVIDLQGSPRTALTAFLSGAVRRVGFDYRWRKLFYSQKVKRDNRPKYSSAFKLDILKPFSITASDLQPELYLTNQARAWQERYFAKYKLNDQQLKIAVSPLSRRFYKRWPLEKFGQLCGWLQDRFAVRIILIWGPGERLIAERVAQLAGPQILISDQTSSLLDLGALLEGCDLFLGNDNGVKHIATAVGIPTFTIYGPSDPVSWTYPDPKNHRFIKGICSCAGNQKNRCPGPACLTSISVTQVGDFLTPFIEEIISRKVTGKLAQA